MMKTRMSGIGPPLTRILRLPCSAYAIADAQNENVATGTAHADWHHDAQASTLMFPISRRCHDGEITMPLWRGAHHAVGVSRFDIRPSAH